MPPLSTRYFRNAAASVSENRLSIFPPPYWRPRRFRERTSAGSCPVKKVMGHFIKFASVSFIAPPSTFISALIFVRSLSHLTKALSDEASAHQSDRLWRIRVNRTTPRISRPLPITRPPGSPRSSGGTSTLPRVIFSTTSPNTSLTAPTSLTIDSPGALTETPLT